MAWTGKRFLSDEEAQAIMAAVRRAEARTGAEIVPLVVERSHEYPAAVALGALAVALAVATPLAWRLGGSMWIFLALLGGGFFAGLGLMRLWPAARRPFISDQEMAEEVEEAAAMAFLRHGFHRGGEAREALLYVSIFERRAAVLASPAVARVLPDAVWSEAVREVVLGGAAGRLGEGVVRAVEKMGARLGAVFPADSGDGDERENLLRE